MTLMKESAMPDSGRGARGATRNAHDSALATVGEDETGEMGRGRTLAVRRSVPSNQPDVCLVTEGCNEETGWNLQVVMGKG
jgi:hypothetical protein